MSDEKEEIVRHVAGATIVHKSKFSELVIPKNEGELAPEFIKEYVNPFYLGRIDSEKFRDGYQKIEKDISPDLILKLLGEFNWRPRKVGALFAAIKLEQEFEDTIGKLLLRSDVCYAGHSYCLALSSFASDAAVDYLREYLDYYLDQIDLWFDQASAMAALEYLGRVKGIDYTTSYLGSWGKFVKNKQNWDLKTSSDGFSQEMEIIVGYRRENSS